MQTPLSSKYSKGCKMLQLYNNIAMQSEMREIPHALVGVPLRAKCLLNIIELRSGELVFSPHLVPGNSRQQPYDAGRMGDFTVVNNLSTSTVISIYV